MLVREASRASATLAVITTNKREKEKVMQHANMKNEASQPGSSTTSFSTLFEETRDQRTELAPSPGSTATPFYTFHKAVLSEDWSAVESQLADDIE
jgi:hypothetical protein